MLILIFVFVYFLLLMGISRLTAGRGATNEAFYRAGRHSPWPLVAFGMVGASMSGVTFVSVPGMVLTSAMGYLQVCAGFIIGYAMVAFVLLPLYYGLRLTSIYSYLGDRLGRGSYLSGAWLFLVSKMAGAAVKFYVVCLVLQQLVFADMGVPFWCTVVVLTLLIWLYTKSGGVRTLVFTDSLQTLCLLASLLIIIFIVSRELGLSPWEAFQAVTDDERSRVLFTDDWSSPQFLWKQLLSGAFIVVVMTGLDQDMMQKNLTCRTLREAQKNMCCYGLTFLPVNALFLGLGVLLARLTEAQGAALPVRGDELLTSFVASQGQMVSLLFTMGIVAASFSTADSALTALTTSYCVDIRQRPDDVALRRRTHVAMCIIFVAVILAVDFANSSSLIDAIYTIVGYTYGPLLGLFAFGLFTRWKVGDRWVPAVCVASPVVCWGVSTAAAALWDYHFGYELLMFNGMLTFAGLWIVRLR